MSDKVPVIVTKLSNDKMIQIMARENLTQWSSHAEVEHETVMAVVRAYAEGKIELPQVRINERDKRYAPNVLPGSECSENDCRYIYSELQVAKFLGWTQGEGSAIRPNAMCRQAFDVLEAIEQGYLTEADMAGLQRNEARVLYEQARKSWLAQMEKAERARKEGKERIAAERHKMERQQSSAERPSPRGA